MDRRQIDKQAARQTDRQAGIDGKVPLTAASRSKKHGSGQLSLLGCLRISHPPLGTSLSPKNRNPSNNHWHLCRTSFGRHLPPTTDINKVQLSSPADHKMQLIFWPPRKSIAPVRQNDFRHLMMSQGATPATQNDVARRLKPPKVRVLFHIQARHLQSFPSSLHMCAGVNFSFTSLLRCQSHWKVFSLWFFRAVNLASRCIINVCLVGGTCVDNVVSRTWSSGR